MNPLTSLPLQFPDGAVRGRGHGGGGGLLLGIGTSKKSAYVSKYVSTGSYVVPMMAEVEKKDPFAIIHKKIP